MRKSAGYSTQGKFAQAIKVKRATVAKWETGENCPKTKIIPIIANCLHRTEGEVIAAFSILKKRRENST